MVLLENDSFLTALNNFYQKSGQRKGSVFINMKRVPLLESGKRAPQKDVKGGAEVENKCLVRATFGKKKISTYVTTKDVVKFQLAMNGLIKINVDNLKKEKKRK
mmetsp:Transcript_47041/g.121537  ORF Transcript_47041/g.121537 Transcript_47041/m.121537 type:complete len:104 (-) Transcript_47041:283-594(-)|eukprot:CAMPEP_0113880736 /NCGR_PEP_ID=MMETSP0780_2-20120614/7957_1 /TAXON_ID=652834 /ORGANISM="Palpitomonas bilix" /LENGTH=103 /DNA_ID=CAMNT_0000867457 /DNA_START=151 /DNA_END=462 /DNA_ORIENTATION=+ /assembly_acc=CAM_ASM_000599